MASQHVIDLGNAIQESYAVSNSNNFNDYLKNLRKQFNDKKAKQYYDNIEQYYEQFEKFYNYLETISNKYGFQIKESYDIISDIDARIQFLSDITGIKDLDFLNQLFNVNSLKNIANNLLQLSSEAYIFGGEQLGEIKGNQGISELIGIQVSNGKNKASLEEYLLNSDQSLAFISRVKQAGGMVLIPQRDSNGKITDFSFGVKLRSRELGRNILSETGDLIGQLPIASNTDNYAAQLLNAIVQGKSIVINNQTYNFSDMGANFGNRMEGLTAAVYQSYISSGELVSGTVLEDIIVNQLTTTVQDQKTGINKLKFIIPATTSGLADADIITPLKYGGVEEFVQNKNIGDSRRFTYGNMKGVQEVMGFYAGIGTFNQNAEKKIEYNYNTIRQSNISNMSEISNSMNLNIWNTIVEGLSDQGLTISGVSSFNSDDGAIISDEAIISLLMGALEGYG